MDLFGAEPAFEDEDIFEEAVSMQDASADSSPLSPRTIEFCLGHEALEGSLLTLFREKRLPHAIIFAGLEGIGKSTLAFRFAKFLLSQEEGSSAGLFGEAPLPENFDIAPSSAAFRQVATGAHPDFLGVERKIDEVKGRKAGTLDVEEIRKIAPFLRLKSSNGGWRVVLVDDADTMNRSAQNSILKILEEPPPKTIIILIAHRPGALIPTIRSRARLYALRPPSYPIFVSLLRKLGQGALGEAEMCTLYELSSGSVGRALNLLEEGGLDNLGLILGLFANWPQVQWSAIHLLGDDLGRPGADSAFEMFCANMLWISESLARTKARGQNLPAPLQNGVFAEILKNRSLTELSKLHEMLEDHLAKTLHSNLDKREAVLRCFALWAKT